jgi:hypothetical protein
MSTLQDRLREIAKDRGEDAPDGRYFESLLGLSSGRISQIFAAGSTDSIGPKSIRKLTDLGYNASWILEGKGEKRAVEMQQQPKIPPDVFELVDIYMRLSVQEKELALLDLKYRADREFIINKSLQPPPPQNLSPDPKQRRVG